MGTSIPSRPKDNLQACPDGGALPASIMGTLALLAAWKAAEMIDNYVASTDRHGDKQMLPGWGGTRPDDRSYFALCAFGSSCFVDVAEFK
jgi:hypothetical protein